MFDVCTALRSCPWATRLLRHTGKPRGEDFHPRLRAPLRDFPKPHGEKALLSSFPGGHCAHLRDLVL